jgi:phage I-like protein
MIRLLSSTLIETPLTEFRVFEKGLNRSTQGSVVFSSSAAANTLAKYLTHGVDVMIDLEHLSLDTESNAYNPDAMGWAKLTVRDGELWAVDVRWTPEGEERIASKKQRYISPAFNTDRLGNVTSIFNLALCAMPATYRAQHLIAATKGNQMEELKAIALALGLSEDASLEDILEAVKVLQTAPVEATEDEPPSEEATAEEDDEEKVEATKALSALVKQVASLQSRLNDRDKDAFISKHSNKIPPTLEKWAKTQTIAQLQEWIKGAPDIVSEPATQPEQKHTVSLTDEEKQICKLTGIKPADLLKYKEAN